MAAVVEQRGEAQVGQIIGRKVTFKSAAPTEGTRLSVEDSFGYPRDNGHHPKAVLKTAVTQPWVGGETTSGLANPTEALDYGRINDGEFIGKECATSPHAISDRLGFTVPTRGVSI